MNNGTAVLTPEYQLAYSQLNPEQKRAVDLIEGPLAVTAGPGTGKTQIVTVRIARILQQLEVKPENILAITFTESAAQTMRKRLLKLIGPSAHKVYITTYHALCADIITTHPSYFTSMRAEGQLSPLDQKTYLTKILAQLELEHLRPLNAPELYLTAIMHSISTLKREAISPAKLQQLAEVDLLQVEEEEKARKKPRKTHLDRARKIYEKNCELAKIFEAYNQLLLQQKEYDFDDLLVKVNQVLANHKELALTYQETFQHIMVDEYQDSNNSQLELLNHLTQYWGAQANICVVGDPNQSIFRFQGAASANFHLFQEKFPQAPTIALTTGYRCPQPIYDAAFKLMDSAGQAQTPKPLQNPFSEHANQVLFLKEAPLPELEVASVVLHVKFLLAQGVQPSEIGILYRTNIEAIALTKALENENILYEIGNSLPLEEFPALFELLSLLQSLHSWHQGAEVDWYKILSSRFFGLDRLALLKLTHLAGKIKGSHRSKLQALITNSKHQEKISNEGISPLELASFKSSIATFEKLAVSAQTLTSVEWFAFFLNELAVIDYLQNHPQERRSLLSLRQFAELIGAQSQIAKGTSILEKVAEIDMHQPSLATPGFELDQAVSLSTAHRAKGREWQHVIILSAISGKWGARQQRNLINLPSGIVNDAELELDPDAEERRLFYVALTRASSQVIISRYSEYIQQDRAREVHFSQFVDELGQTKVVDSWTKSETESQRQQAAAAKLLSPEVSLFQVSQQERAFFEKLVQNFKLSASSLTAYLQDRHQFVEQYLLKLPLPSLPVLGYGSAMHAAVERIGRARLEEDTELQLEQVLEHFEYHLKRSIADETEQKRRFERGSKVLRHHYAELFEPKPVAIEQFYGHGVRQCKIGEISLVGKIDRIEWISETEKIVKVIDFKTGRSKSKNQIIGSTQSAGLSQREAQLPPSIRGPLMRQLVFYKLLIELDRSTNWKVSSGSFIFLEHKKGTEMLERSFELPDSAVSDLKQLIITVIDEIKSLSFLEVISSSRT